MEKHMHSGQDPIRERDSARGSSSASQAEGRGFKSNRPLQRELRWDTGFSPSPFSCSQPEVAHFATACYMLPCGVGLQTAPFCDGGRQNAAVDDASHVNGVPGNLEAALKAFGNGLP